MNKSEFAHRIFALAVATIGSEQSPPAARRDAALMVGLLATIMVPSEAELSDLLRATPAAFGDAFAVETITLAFSAFRVDQQRVGIAVARLARRALEECEVLALNEISAQAVQTKAWRPSFGEDLFAAALRWAVHEWPKNERAAVRLVRRALAPNAPIPDWMLEQREYFPRCVTATWMPRKSAVRLHERKPSTGGWHFLSNAGGADELIFEPSSFGRELDAVHDNVTATVMMSNVMSKMPSVTAAEASPARFT